MAKYKIPVYWDSVAIVEVEADTIEEAIEKAEEYPDNLPEFDVVDGTYCVDCNRDVDIISAVYNEGRR